MSNTTTMTTKQMKQGVMNYYKYQLAGLSKCSVWHMTELQGTSREERQQYDDTIEELDNEIRKAIEKVLTMPKTKKLVKKH